MFIVIENGASYHEINEKIINHHASQKFAYVSDKPRFDYDSEKWSREITQSEKDSAIDEIRKYYYIKYADPIYFKWQRGEATEQDWLDKISEIKARFKKGGN